MLVLFKSAYECVFTCNYLLFVSFIMLPRKFKPLSGPYIGAICIYASVLSHLQGRGGPTKVQRGSLDTPKMSNE